MKMKFSNKSYSNNVIVVANDNDNQQLVGTCLTPKVEISCFDATWSTQFFIPGKYVDNSILTFETTVGGVTEYATMDMDGSFSVSYPSENYPIRIDYMGYQQTGPSEWSYVFNLVTLVPDNVRVIVRGNNESLIFNFYDNENPAAMIIDNVLYTCLASMGGSGSNSGSGDNENTDPEPTYPSLSYSYYLADDNTLAVEFVNHTPQFDIPAFRVTVGNSTDIIQAGMEVDGKYTKYLALETVEPYPLTTKNTTVELEIELLADPYDGDYSNIPSNVTVYRSTPAALIGQSFATLEASVDGTTWPSNLKYNLCLSDSGDSIIKDSSGNTITTLSSIQPGDGSLYYFRISSISLTGYEFIIKDRAMQPIPITASPSAIFKFDSICTFSRSYWGPIGSFTISKEVDAISDDASYSSMYAERAYFSIIASQIANGFAVSGTSLSGKVGRIFGAIDFTVGLTGIAQSDISVKAVNVRGNDSVPTGARFSSTDIVYNSASGVRTATANFAPTVSYTPNVDGSWGTSGTSYFASFLVLQIVNPYKPEENLLVYSEELRYEVNP